jgi:TfoX/Sxy family transcriptional regulator of competence genes
MTKQTIELDMRRGMAAQKATELRRLMSEVVANEELLRGRQKELEEQLLATPAATWADAADKARYLLSLYASSPAAQDPRRQLLIARVLEDFVHLSSPDTN